MLCCLQWRDWILRGYETGNFGTGGLSRARATSRDTARVVVDGLDRDHQLGKCLQKRAFRVARAGALLPLSFTREEVTGRRTVARLVRRHYFLRRRNRGGRSAGPGRPDFRVPG